MHRMRYELSEMVAMECKVSRTGSGFGVWGQAMNAPRVFPPLPARAPDIRMADLVGIVRRKLDRPHLGMESGCVLHGPRLGDQFLEATKPVAGADGPHLVQFQIGIADQ